MISATIYWRHRPEFKTLLPDAILKQQACNQARAGETVDNVCWRALGPTRDVTEHHLRPGG